jgi:hypothetical protein
MPSLVLVGLPRKHIINYALLSKRPTEKRVEWEGRLRESLHEDLKHTDTELLRIRIKPLNRPVVFEEEDALAPLVVHHWTY